METTLIIRTDATTAHVTIPDQTCPIRITWQYRQDYRYCVNDETGREFVRETFIGEIKVGFAYARIPYVSGDTAADRENRLHVAAIAHVADITANGMGSD